MSIPDFHSWPTVPEDQVPKKLYHAGLVTPEVSALLSSRGWLPVDVRLLPNKTDIDRAEALKDWLEGVRLGTIEPDPKSAKFVELEARVYGLAQGKSPAGKRSNETDTAPGAGQSEESRVTMALNFGQDRAFSVSADQQSKAKLKKRGRPVEEE